MEFSKFLEIRKAYADILPGWMAEYEATGEMRHAPYFMDWEFTPIERCVWEDIRNLGLPFYPQIPVLKYFLDFGCPFLKIGIECDGKAWHDSDTDRKRDENLAAAGWMIFRIEGHECKRVVEPWDDRRFAEDEEDHRLVAEHFMSTSEGILSAIKRRYFEPSRSEKYQFLVDSTLFEHRSTPETSPVLRKRITRGPTLIGDLLPGYLDLMIQRLDRAAM